MKDSSPVWGSRFFLISGTKTYNSSLQTSPNSVHKNDTSKTSNSAGWNWLHIKLLHVSRLHQSIPGVEHTSTCERPDPGYRKEGRLHASLPLHQASQQKKEMQVDTEMPSGALQEHSKEASSSPATSGEAQGSFLSEHRAESRNPTPK